MKTKTLNNEAMIRNINGLSLGDRAYCGPYGTITCYKNAACNWNSDSANGSVVRNTRMFSVSGSSKLRNGGNWTMKALRKAITK